MDTARFDYLTGKVRSAKFSHTPFKHIYIENFFSAEDFQQITNANENRIPPATSDEVLFDKLFESGYKIISFPGCITNKKEYIKWHSTRERNTKIHTACEGFGMTLRLVDAKSDVIKVLKEFVEGAAFNRAIAEKFEVLLDDCDIDGGIQKYLDGYEISPHPDIRRKALTFMVNINPHDGSESLEHHTHYLSFKENRKYVRSLWDGNTNVERCWVPWEWCDTVRMQRTNNSIVILSPTNDTMHAVKASYNHLAGQRTQLYGNLWYKKQKTLAQLQWEDLDVIARKRSFSKQTSLKQKVKDIFPTPIRSLAIWLIRRKGFITGKSSEIVHRDFR